MNQPQKEAPRRMSSRSATRKREERWGVFRPLRRQKLVGARAAPRTPLPPISYGRWCRPETAPRPRHWRSFTSRAKASPRVAPRHGSSCSWLLKSATRQQSSAWQNSTKRAVHRIEASFARSPGAPRTAFIPAKGSRFNETNRAEATLGREKRRLGIEEKFPGLVPPYLTVLPSLLRSSLIVHALGTAVNSEVGPLLARKCSN